MSKISDPKMSLNCKSTATDVTNLFGEFAVNKYVIITGSNCGIGLETARVLAKNCSIVTIASRSAKNGEEAVATIKAEFPQAQVSLLLLDLTSFDSIRKFAADYKATGKPLHLLINNAGVMACPKIITGEGLELQFGTNHIGHFLLTTLLLDVIKTSGTANEPARIINVSSLANYILGPPQGIFLDDLNADKSYDPWVRYGASKLANILFTKQLQRIFEREHANVTALALHPGNIADTSLGRYSGSLMSVALSLVWRLSCNWTKLSAAANSPLKTIPEGAATTVYCALAPEVAQQGGEYYLDCRVESVQVHPLAIDAQLAQDLWNASEAIVNR